MRGEGRGPLERDTSQEGNRALLNNRCLYFAAMVDFTHARRSRTASGTLPHCGVCKPRPVYRWNIEITPYTRGNQRRWHTYECVTCGGAVLTVTWGPSVADVRQFWPSLPTVSDAVPGRARLYLTQALGSLHAPAGALMRTASCLVRW
jgi:hypothetical protein